MIKSIVSPLLVLILAASSLHADQQLDSLKYVSAAGAPFLTLKMLDQAQPKVDEDLYEWILWEQERFKILSQWAQWNDLLVRIESLPQDLPEQFTQQAASYQARAYLELGQTGTARKILRERLWQDEAGSANEYRQWRELVIESYLKDDRIDDARIAMLRLQQDFPHDDRDWVLLRARVLMQAQRYDEAIEVLSGRIGWRSLAMKLLAEYRDGQHDAKTVWDLARKRIEAIEDDPEQRASYWAIASIVAAELDTPKVITALEARLGIAADKLDKLYRIDATRLWQAYRDYAQLVGNRSELLYGDDASWLELAQKAVQPTPIKARSLLAFLMQQSQDPEIRAQAATEFLSTLNLEDSEQQMLLSRLFSSKGSFADAASIPVEIRFQLVDQSLKRADITEATRLMSGLTSVPQNISEFDWLLRQARVLLLGGKWKQGVETLDRLFLAYAEPNQEDTDRILQVLFDLQTIEQDEAAVGFFRRLMTMSIEPRQKREILFWMGDSFKGLEQFERAALLYLQSAMFIGPDAMDPWAQTARFNAAESLQKAGLVDDARRIFQALLKITEEPARRSVLRHRIQQLWLTQNSY